jgi:Fe-S-cluster-containing hydrogenase component 2
MAYVIEDTCTGRDSGSCREDGSFPCVEACPVDGIHGFTDDTQLYVNTDECIDCGACYPACPVDAVAVDYDVPEAVRLGNMAHFATLYGGIPS